MKLLRPLAGYTLYDHKTNDYIRRELRITGLLDKIDEYRRNWLSHLHKTESLWNHTTTDHKEGEQMEDRRSVGASSCNSGDGTDQSPILDVYDDDDIQWYFLHWHTCVC